MAGWRDGYYYEDDGGWGEGYYAPAPDRQTYGDDGYAYGDGGYYRRPWGGRRVYVPRVRGDSAYGDGGQDVMPPWHPRPPRNVEAALPDRPDLAPGEMAPGRLPRKPVSRPKVASNMPARPPAAVALPVPRPNLESMDFDSSGQSVGSVAQKPATVAVPH